MRYTINRKLFLVPVISFFFILSSPAQIMVGDTEVDTTSIVTGLDTPWEVIWGPDNHLWITERYGRVSRVDPATGDIREILVIDEVHESGESGLLGMALHRDFKNKPLVYLVYTYLDAEVIKEKLVRYTYQDGSLVSPLVMLENIPGASYHDGSRIVIDHDNYIYISTGDAGVPSSAQDLNSLSGKILRLRPDGSVPASNPFPNSYVWSYGHRNPQGMVVAPGGNIYSSEHGPDSDDEVNIIRKGGNYGWPEVEGYCDLEEEIDFCDFYVVTQPIKAWTPTLAVAGIDIYLNNAIPEWNQSLLMATLKESQLVELKLDDAGNTILQQRIFFDNWFGRLRDVAVSPYGDIYFAVSNRDGRGDPAPGDDRIVRIRAVNQNSVNSGQKEIITIYPNPLSGNELRVQKVVNRQVTLSIFDEQGKKLLEKIIPTGEKTIQIDFPYPPGIYFVTNTSSDTKTVSKLIKLE